MANMHAHVIPHQSKQFKMLLADAIHTLWLNVHKGENEPRKACNGF